MFRKLFQILVLGGAAIGAGTGCSTAQAQQATDNKPDARKNATTADGGTAAPQGSNDKGTADAGGGGVEGW